MNTTKQCDRKFDYDEKFYELIRKNLKRKTFKYKELCDLLEQDPKGGTQKARQIKEWQRYMNIEYNEKTKKYKISEKYDTPLPPYKTDPPRSVYSKHIKTLLLNYLLKEKKYNEPIYISSDKLYVMLGMINNQYIQGKKNDKKGLVQDLQRNLVFSKKYSAENLPNTTLMYYINDFYQRSGSKLATILKSSLDSLENQSYLVHSRAYRLYHKNAYPSYATDAEVEIILEIERDVKDEFGFSSDKDIWFKGRKNEYWDRVLELVQKIYPDIIGVYRCHKIIASKINLEKALSREEETKEMHELNRKILAFIDLQAEKNAFRSEENEDPSKRLSVRYLDAQKYLSNKLIKNKEQIAEDSVKNEFPRADFVLDLSSIGICEDDPEWFKEVNFI